MDEGTNIGGLASKIQAIFEAAKTGIDNSTKSIAGLYSSIDKLSNIKYDDLDKFANGLKQVMEFEKEYIKLTQMKANAEKTMAEATKVQLELEKKQDEVGRSRIKTIEDVAKATDRNIKQKQVEYEALKNHAVVIDGEIKQTRALLIEKEKISTAAREQTNLMKAQASVEKNEQMTLEQLASKYQIVGNAIKELEVQNKALRDVAKSTNIVEDTDKLEKYNTIISANSFLIKANSDASVQQALNIGNYKSALESNTGEVITNAQALDELKKKYFEIQNQLAQGGGLDALQGDMEMSEEEFKKLETELQGVANEILNIEKASKGMEGAGQQTVSFRTKMRELRDEILEMDMQMEKGIELTDEQKQKYNELNKEMVVMTDLMSDANSKWKTLSSDTVPLDRVIDTVNLAAGAMQAYQGGIELLGLSTESYEKVMRRFAALQSTINGLSQIQKALQDGTTFSLALNSMAQSKNNAVKLVGIGVQKSLNAAIKASPYVAVALALVFLISKIAEYIYNANDMGKISKDLKVKLDALNSAMEKSIDSYAETTVKINNYRMAMESTTITAKGEKKVMDALNETLEDSGIHFETIQEAKQWLKDNSDAYITTLQNEALATALFSLQTEDLKTALKDLQTGFEDFNEITWGEKAGEFFKAFSGKLETNIEDFAYMTKNSLVLMLQGRESFDEAIKFLEKASTGDVKKVVDPFISELKRMKEAGTLTKEVIEKIDVDWIRQVATQGAMNNALNKNKDVLKSLLGVWAEYLKTTEKVGEGKKTKEWTKNLKFITEDVSKLYKIFANESKKIAETWKEMSGMGMEESKFLDYNLFQQLSGQIIEDFEQLSLSVQTFSGENSEYFKSLIHVSGQYAKTMSNLEQLTGVERLKKLQSLQEEVLAQYTQGENALLKLKKDNNDELKKLQKEYSGNITEERARDIEARYKEIDNEQKKITQSLTNIEKLRLEHQKNVNEIQQLESDIHIQIIEQEIEKERLLRGIENEDEIRGYEEKYGILDRLLSLYAKKTKDIRTKQTFEELFRQKKEIDVARLRNAMQLNMYQAEKDSLLAIINDPSATAAQKKAAADRLAIINATIASILSTEKDLSRKSIEIDEATNVERAKLAQDYNETVAKGITQLYETVGQIGSEIDNLMSAIDERRQAELDRELERIDTWKEAQLDAIEKTAMTDEDRIAKTSEAEKIAAKKSYEIEVEKWKLEVQAAKRRKVLDAASATSAYAMGMVKAYADYMTNPLTLALGVGVMAGLSALYAIQLVTIGATRLPIKPDPPQYADGTMYHKGGLAVVGDGGKREVIEAKGKTFLTPDYATLIDLPRGAKVYKDYEDYITNRWVQNQENGDTFDNSGIIDAIRKNKASMSLYFDRNGIYTVSKNGINKDTYITNTLKLSK